VRAVENHDFNLGLHTAHFFQTYRIHKVVVSGLDIEDWHVDAAEIVEYVTGENQADAINQDCGMHRVDGSAEVAKN
jgi:hypothetical protein